MSTATSTTGLDTPGVSTTTTQTFPPGVTFTTSTTAPPPQVYISGEWYFEGPRTLVSSIRCAPGSERAYAVASMTQFRDVPPRELRGTVEFGPDFRNVVRYPAAGLVTGLDTLEFFTTPPFCDTRGCCSVRTLYANRLRGDLGFGAPSNGPASGNAVLALDYTCDGDPTSCRIEWTGTLLRPVPDWVLR
jgi:hypothetical protein